jgi:Ankyrin repeats (3 copies)
LKLSTNSMLSTKSSMTSGFVPYAQTHWMFHYKRGERRSTYLAGLLHDILEQGFKFSRKNGHTAEDNLKPNTRGTSPEVGYRQIDMERNNFESLNVVNIALGVGARFGFTKLAKLELDMGANINAPSGPEKQTPLCLASKWGHIEVARLLLQRGADPFKASGSGLTPMAYAIANGHYEIRNLLMTYQAKGLLKSGSLGEFGGSQDASQKYRLTIMSSLLCTSCTEFRVVYEVSKAVRKIM